MTKQFKTVLTALACLAALLATAPASKAAENVSTTFERGVYQEETAGDIDAAISTYRQIIKDDAANRQIVAQAYLRLGNCLLKKNRSQEAEATFKTLISQYPDQKELMAKAQKLIAAGRSNMSDAEVAKAVESAIDTISTCAETDPRLSGVLESLKGLPQKAMLSALSKYLESDKDTIRRSAVYVLMKGDFDNIDPVVPALMKLRSHQEDYTRGMAALALGQNKVASSFQVLCDMATKDDSAYARRCAAYALGLLGEAKAKDVLEKVLKDPDKMVRNNAEAALKMLSKKGAAESKSAPHVVKTTPAALANDVDPSLDKITVTFDQPMMDRSWSWCGSGETYPKTPSEPYYDAGKTTCTLPVKLEPGKVYWVGINSPSYRNFQNPQRVPAVRYVILFATKTADGKTVDFPPDLLSEAKEINAAAEIERAVSSEAKSASAVSQSEKMEAENLTAQAWKLWGKRQLSEAEELFSLAVKKDPSNANAFNGLGWSQFNQGKAENAVDSFQKCLALEPKHAAALNGMGWIAKNKGNTAEALEYWKKAVAAAPTATAALSGLASTYMEMRQYQEAAKYYKMWLDAEPENPDAKAGLSKAQAAGGK